MSGIVNGIFVTTLDKIIVELLAYEHDPSCQTWEGLTKELERVYGDLGFDPTVTLLFFEILDEPSEE